MADAAIKDLKMNIRRSRFPARDLKRREGNIRTLCRITLYFLHVSFVRFSFFILTYTGTVVAYFDFATFSFSHQIDDVKNNHTKCDPNQSAYISCEHIGRKVNAEINATETDQ